MKRFLTAVACIGLLAGCSQVSATEVSKEPAPATPEQVASVIAANEPDWREAIDRAGECRLIWALDDPSDPISKLPGMTCYLQEQTAGFTATTAIRDIEKLEIPESMETLVSATVDALRPLADGNLSEVCGDAEWPAETPDCNAALASNFSSFTSLETALDGWKPYF